jgi:HK97 family phage portal protein
MGGSGVNITSDSALKLSTVYACVRIYVDTISTLPVDAFIRIDGDRRPFRPKPLWIESPDAGVTRQDHLVQVMVSLLLDGNAFILVLRNDSGDVIALTVLDPKRVEISRNAAREIQYLYDKKTVFSSSEMLHITEMK